MRAATRKHSSNKFIASTKPLVRGLRTRAMRSRRLGKAKQFVRLNT